MTLACLTTAYAAIVEAALTLLSLWALALAGFRFRRGDGLEGTALIGLAVIGAFSLVALDAARRGAGL